MTLRCLSVSHATAPLAVRELLAYDSAALHAALASASEHSGAMRSVNELAILSTCHRVELYAVTDESGEAWDALLDFLACTRSVDRRVFESHAERLTGTDVVSHLCQVASGLCSVVLGESEVLGQVDRAHRAADRAGSSGPTLAMLFRTAVRAGRRARAETDIGRNAASIGTVAVELAGQLANDVRGRHVLVVGAGKMGARAAAALRTRGDWQIAVMNRTYHRAQELAEASHGRGMSVEMLRDGLEWADVVITSTGAPHTVITPALVREVMASREERPLICIDIAVPRDVDPAVREIPGVHVFDIDEMQERADDGIAARRAAVPRVEQIVREQVDRFEEWQRRLELQPLLRELRQQAEGIRRRELERTLERLPALDDATREQVEHLSISLMNRLLHEPTRRLRHDGNEAGARIIRELFGLKIED